MNDYYEYSNGVLTHFITYGNPFENGGKDVVICITGNPGLPGFYTDFVNRIFETTKLDIVIIGNAGHEIVSDEKSNKLNGQEHLFNLDGQLLHKIDFIKSKINENSKIHLIAHSIGAWMSIEILDAHDDILQKVKSINFLFPTIQHMAITKNGSKLNYLRKFHSLLMIAYILLDFLPDFIKDFIVGCYLKYKNIPESVHNTARKYIKPTVVEKVLFLAYDEMDRVLELNMNGLNKIKSLTNVIFGERDGWAPVSYLKHLEVFQPEMKLKLVNIEHAFILRSSEQVADLVTEFIIPKLKSP